MSRCDVIGDVSSGAVAPVSATEPPVGSIIPFYDFNGVVTFDLNFWAYCDGSIINNAASPLDGLTLPDLSNRYLTGFGTENGGNIGFALWDATPVGLPNHQTDLQHSHIVNSHSHTGPFHGHAAGTLHAKIALNSGGFDGIEAQHVTVSSWTANAADTAGTATIPGTSTQAVDVGGATTNTSGGNTGFAGPGTNQALLSIEDVRPRSIRVRYIMRIV